MGGRIAVGQGAVAGRRNDLVIEHNHAADRHFAGFSGFSAAFSAKSMKDGAVMPRLAHKTLLLRTAFSKSGYRFCVRMRPPAKSARIVALPARPRPSDCQFIDSETLHAAR